MNLVKIPLMIAKLRLVFSFSILFTCFSGLAQHGYWKQEGTKPAMEAEKFRKMDVSEGRLYSVDQVAVKRILADKSMGNRPKILYFPDADGKLLAFEVTESPVLSPALSAKYPEIKSFIGKGLNGRHDKIRFSMSHKGIQSMIVHGDRRPATFMQMASKDMYMVYSRDGQLQKDIDFVCETKSSLVTTTAGLVQKPVDGQVLRKYRLAVSASGEYTQYHGGTVADALAAINATVTRVNEVFETDLAVSLELVADTDKVIYTNSATDPYNGNLNAEAQSAFNTEIGAANYDIGHLFHKANNGGNAGFIGRICVDNQKGSAFAAAQVPEGDIFDLDFVGHEMGHQLGANHTWSFESEGTLVQFEPGSGSTIMGYAGITGINNVALNGDDYFHYISIVQILDNLESKSCGTLIPLANNPPVVDAGIDHIIPKSTAFALTGSATDADPDDILTYTWEEIDDGVVPQSTFGPNNPSGANFRSLRPDTLPIRYFPRLSRILSGNLTQSLPTVNSAWETVSNVERQLNFAFTVRDNAPGGGQVVSDLVNIRVINAAGPFAVTSQSSGEAVTAGQVTEITWNVANTDLSPINAQSVDLLLSTDGGQTFPIILAAGVANNGRRSVIIPGMPTTQARIMVKPQGNVFFAVNALNFSILDSEIILAFPALEYEICQPDDLLIDFDYITSPGFAEEATFSISSPPTGLDISFLPETADITDTPVEITISNTANVAPGSYTINVLATTASLSKEVSLVLNVYDGNFATVPLLSPLNGALDVPTVQTLQWEGNSLYTGYDLELATDMAFNSIVQSVSLVNTSFQPSGLNNQTTYYWRVKPKNICGEGTFGLPFSFTTIQFNCQEKSASGLPLTISATGTPTISSKIAFVEDLPLADINVSLELDHTFLADLVITLTSPSGTVTTLISSSCGDLGNINAVFDDEGGNFTCGGDPAISGTIKPLGPLSVFNGESIKGEWILQVSDNAASDGGSLKSFSLEVCVEGAFSPDEDGDGVFDANDICPGTPPDSEVDLSGCPVYRLDSKNFEISVQSESCRPNNDGIIDISAVLPLNYGVTVTGNGTDVSANFSESYSLPNLMAGTYVVCIDAIDGDIVYQPSCYEVVITEPDPLNVTAKTSLDGSQLILSLTGSDYYIIEFNGQTIQTNEDQLILDLQKGGNSLKVMTGLSCQGIFEDRYLGPESLFLLPNPAADFVTIYGNDSEMISIEVYGADGRNIYAGTRTMLGSQTILDVSGWASGTYFLKVRSATRTRTFKLIKQ